MHLTVSVVSRLSLIPFQHLQSVMNWDHHHPVGDILCLLSAHRTAGVTKAALRTQWLFSPLCFPMFDSDLYETCFLMHACFLSLSHSNVCPSTGQCPNGLSCFPSLSLCKYSGSPSDFTRTRQRSVHACLDANKHATHSINVCLYLSPPPPPLRSDIMK